MPVILVIERMHHKELMQEQEEKLDKLSQTLFNF